MLDVYTMYRSNFGVTVNMEDHWEIAARAHYTRRGKKNYIFYAIIVLCGFFVIYKNNQEI